MADQEPTTKSAIARIKSKIHGFHPKSRHKKTESNSAASVLGIESLQPDPNDVSDISVDTEQEDGGVTSPDTARSNFDGIWNEAFQSLSKDSQRQLNPISSDDENSVFLQPELDKLKEDVQQKQDQCEKNAWKLQINDHNIIIQDYAAKIATWLQRIGDVVIPFAPKEASPPWGVVRGLLQLPVNHKEQMLAILGTVEIVAQTIFRGQIYELVYTSNLTLRNALVKVYAATLELLANANHQLSKGLLHQIIGEILDPNQASGLLKDLQDRQDDLDRVVFACEISRSAEADNLLMSALREINTPLARIDARIDKYLSEVDTDRSLELLARISSIPYNAHHAAIQGDRTEDTCNWILETDQFRSWEKSSSPALLYLWGPPGTGKTFLTSKVIDRLKMTLKNQNHEGFAFFYCNRSEEIRRQPLSVLQSFLRQLASTSSNWGAIQKSVIEADINNRRNGEQFDEIKCRDLLLKSFNLYPRTTLVLDALDECDSTSREKLLKFLNSISSEAIKPVKIFISSRPDEDIRRQFRAGPNIGVQAGDTQDDIKRFIEKKLSELVDSNDAIYQCQEDIKRKLVAKCDGMFQWTYLQLEQLKICYSKSAIQHRLDQLPVTLKEAYDEIYAYIEKALDKYDKQLADRAIKWVMAAARPLTSEELICAIRIDATKDELYLSESISEDTLLALCRNFLVIDSERAVWKVSHLSVTEYFEQHHWTLQKAHLEIGNSCLLVLLHEPKTENSTWPKLSSSIISVDSRNDDSTEFYSSKPLFGTESNFKRYIWHNWPIHVQEQEGHEPAEVTSMPALLKRFIGSPDESSFCFSSWYHRIREDFELGHGDGPEPRWFPIFGISRFHISKGILDPIECPIFAMCKFGIYTVLGEWWNDVYTCVDKTNEKGETPLYLAVENNHYSICDALLRAGFLVVDTPTDYGFSKHPFYPAAMYGYLDILKLLVAYSQCGVKLRLGEGQVSKHKGGSVLSVAIESDQLQTVQWLLSEAGADVDQPEFGRYGSPLAAAASSGNLDLVQYLIRGGADANRLLQAGYYGSALAAATQLRFHSLNKYDSENCDILNYLIDEIKVDVEMALPVQYGSALIAAAYHCNEYAIGAIINAGANVNKVVDTGKYGTALIAAAFSPWDNSAKSLINLLISDFKAKPNLRLKRNTYGSALCAAAYFGRRDSVKALLANGASISLEVDDRRFSNALEAARAEISPGELQQFDIYLERESARIWNAKRNIAELLQVLSARDVTDPLSD
ncbi:hypothetical protein N7456_001839 [Penicillium angulare]|uniref:NACHT domain-containing protein n=1 Tax=Penicillium angulare TaxID=116970 RepID=A0A9W9G730_9EURO|nr:hypothetical protein N7456_001839 [Penicillium angulare]